MTYKVELIKSEEGYAVACPDLPGCHSQGISEEEAMQNIRSAITDYIAAIEEHHLPESPPKEIRYVEVPDQPETIQAQTPYKVRSIPMGLPHFTKAEDLLDEFEGPWRR